MSRIESNQQERSLSAALGRLETLLSGQLHAHRSLLRCVQAKRRAIAGADLAAIDRIARDEQTLLVQARTVERERAVVVASISRILAPDSRAPLTITLIADRVQEPQRALLLALASELREVMTAVRHESSIVRNAAESLSRHLGGLVQTMRTALSRAGIYERQGRIDPGSPLHFGVDIRS